MQENEPHDDVKMEQNNSECSSHTPKPSSPQKDQNPLLFVIGMVLLVCGGNGLGMIVGALLWRFTHMAVISITVAVILSIIAFLLGMILIMRRNRN